MIGKNKSVWGIIAIFLMTIIVSGCETSSEEVLPANFAVTSIENGKADKTITYYGPAKSLGRGVARTWVEVTGDGKPVSIGVNFSAKDVTIAGLPDHQAMYHLDFPEQVSIAPFKGMMFDWNPHGHIPDEVYGKPHFDFHFYMIPEMEHMAIPLDIGHPHSAQFESDYMPADYMSLYLAIPGMGNHWISKAAPELNGQGFTKTMILGAYQDKQIFIEPMISLEYLQSLKPNGKVTEAISQFPKVQKSGYYPRKYTVSYNPTPGEYSIALTELYYREAE